MWNGLHWIKLKMRQLVMIFISLHSVIMLLGVWHRGRGGKEAINTKKEMDVCCVSSLPSCYLIVVKAEERQDHVCPITSLVIASFMPLAFMSLANNFCNNGEHLIYRSNLPRIPSLPHVPPLTEGLPVQWWSGSCPSCAGPSSKGRVVKPYLGIWHWF